MKEESVKAPATPFYRILYVQVIGAVLAGIAFGIVFPEWAVNSWVKALGDDFVRLIRMMIAPIIFCTVVSGIAHVDEAKKVGRVGTKALIYFESVSTLALFIGLLVANLWQPGRGFGGVGANAAAVSGFVKQGEEMSALTVISNIIPDTFFGAFAKGEILQVLLVAILFGFAMMMLGPRSHPVRTFVDDAAQIIFTVFSIILKAAPIGAFGAIAFIVGKYGPGALSNLLQLIACFYVSAILFVVVVLGVIARLVGFNILRFLSYIREEMLLVLGTSSSESALPQLMTKLVALGCSRPVVGLVVPTGYSFNLDGTNIYMTLATLFIAQAMDVDLTVGQQAAILGVAMLTSKGASAVTGAGFITLGATLAAVDPALLPGMAIVFGVDKFMSECRALTNIVGNGVATIVVSAWEGELDRTALASGLSSRGLSARD